METGNEGLFCFILFGCLSLQGYAHQQSGGMAEWVSLSIWLWVVLCNQWQQPWQLKWINKRKEEKTNLRMFLCHAAGLPQKWTNKWSGRGERREMAMVHSYGWPHSSTTNHSDKMLLMICWEIYESRSFSTLVLLVPSFKEEWRTWAERRERGCVTSGPIRDNWMHKVPVICLPMLMRWVSGDLPSQMGGSPLGQKRRRPECLE